MSPRSTPTPRRLRPGLIKSRSNRPPRSTIASSASSSCRTTDTMVRYQEKLMIIDARAAYVLGFIFTAEDLKSRSFGVVVKSRRVVKELAKLFESDANRTDFTPRVGDLIISPENARARL